MSAQILIADDDAVSCQLVAKVLEREGYQVECVLSGNEALERSRERPYDVLLIDVRMAGYDRARSHASHPHRTAPTAGRGHDRLWLD